MENNASTQNDSHNNLISFEPAHFDGKDIKILLVGPDDCGKSTFCRHLSIIQGLENSDQEEVLINIRINLISDIKMLTEFIQLSGQPISEDIEPSIKNITTLGYDVDELTPEIANDISVIWNNPTVKAYYSENNSIGWNENTSFFFDNASRIAQKDYKPTDEDILKTRITTQNNSTLRVLIDHHLKTEIVDLCGKKSERSKWNRLFTDVDYVLFVASLSDFDQSMLEDESVKRTQDSIELFRMISNAPFFKQTPIFLVLNKKDVFETKLKEKPNVFKETYPDFELDTNNVDQCIEHVKTQYLNELPADGINKKDTPIESFVTCAIDKDCTGEFFQKIARKITSAHPKA